MLPNPHSWAARLAARLATRPCLAARRPTTSLAGISLCCALGPAAHPSLRPLAAGLTMPPGTALPCQVYTWEIEDLDYLATRCSPAMAGFWRSFALCQARRARLAAEGLGAGL